MKIEAIYITRKNKFGQFIQEWGDSKNIEIAVHQRKHDLVDLVDGAILFHINHDFTREDLEFETALGKQNKSFHKIDIAGTIAATKSNFIMWLENNSPKNIILLGGDDIQDGAKIMPFLNELL